MFRRHRLAAFVVALLLAAHFAAACPSFDRGWLARCLEAHADEFWQSPTVSRYGTISPGMGRSENGR